MATVSRNMWWHCLVIFMFISSMLYFNYDLGNRVTNMQNLAYISPSYKGPIDRRVKPGEVRWRPMEDFGIDLGGCGLKMTAENARRLSPAIVEDLKTRLICVATKTPWLTPLTGRKIDIADDQWRVYRSNLPLFTSFLLVNFCLSKAVVMYLGRKRLRYFMLLAGISFLVYLHELNLVLLLLPISVNFIVANLFAGAAHTVLLIWVVNLGMLLTVQYLSAQNLGGWLGGHDVDWTSTYPLVMLRLVSYAVDVHHANVKGIQKTTSQEVLNTDPDPGTGTVRGPASTTAIKAREVQHTTRGEQRSVVLYLAYLFYVPLYLTGPTMTYNAFASYLRVRDTSFSSKSLLMYILRYLMCLLLMEVFATYFPVRTLVHMRDKLIEVPGGDGELLTVWEYLLHGSAFTLMSFSYFVLKVTWFKFLVLWRFARLWTLLDGMNCHENMDDCMSNVHSIARFWQIWHGSFNRWLIRYIFIPLGGSRTKGAARQIRNVFVVFTFTAIWHEVSWQLLTWGWLLVLFMAPELVCRRLASSEAGRTFAKQRPVLWSRLQTLGGMCMIFMLKIACLVGFGYQLDGFWRLVTSFFTVKAALQLIVYMHFMYSCVRGMVWLQERRSSDSRSSNKVA